MHTQTIIDLARALTEADQLRENAEDRIAAIRQELNETRQEETELRKRLSHSVKCRMVLYGKLRKGWEFVKSTPQEALTREAILDAFGIVDTDDNERANENDCPF